MEIERPDFLPVTVMLTSRDRERRSFRGSLRVGLLLMQNLLDSGLMPGGSASCEQQKGWRIERRGRYMCCGGDRRRSVVPPGLEFCFVSVPRTSSCANFFAVPEIRSDSRWTLGKIESAVAVQTKGWAWVLEARTD